MDKSKINKILLINFLTLSIFNMAHPVTPTLMNAIGLPTFMFGVLYSAMAIAQFVMSPVWGTISDMRGRKKSTYSWCIRIWNKPIRIWFCSKFIFNFTF